MEGGSVEVAAVRPLDPVDSDMLLERPAGSVLPAMAVRDSAAVLAFLLLPLLPDVEDFRLASAAARALLV